MTSSTRYQLSILAVALAATFSARWVYADTDDPGTGNTWGAGAVAPTGPFNTIYGFDAGNNLTGNFNTGFGLGAVSYTNGDANTGVGVGAAANVIGRNNTAVGLDAGRNVTGDSNTAVGFYAGEYVTGSGNVALGDAAGSGTAIAPLTVSLSTAVGNAARAAGNNSVALGAGSWDGGQANVVSLGATGQMRAIINASAIDTDGVGRLSVGANSAGVTIGQATSANTIQGTVTTIRAGTNSATVDNVNGLTVVGVSNTVTGATRLQASAAAGANALSVDGVNGTTVTGPTNLTGSLAVTGNTGLNGAVNNIGTTQLSNNSIGTVGSTNVITGSTRMFSSDRSSALSVDNSGVDIYGDRAGVAGRLSTTISGGTTRMNLDNNGLALSNVNGGPVRVTGVANGIGPNDAVNVSQLTRASSFLSNNIQQVERRAYSGIASTVAMANIPTPAAGKNFSVGIGYGNYQSRNAVALGGRANLGAGFQFAASVGLSDEGTTVGAGVGYSF